MQRLLAISCSVLLVTSLAAQPNAVGYDVGASDFTSRSGIPGASAGDLVMRVDATTLVGVGNEDGYRISGMSLVLQDQDLATQDRFSFVVYPDDGTGRPRLGAETRGGPFALAMGIGRGAFQVTISLATPLTLPATAYHYGVGIGPAPTWAADGLSVHGGDYNQTPNITNQSAPRITTTIDTTAGVIAFAGLARLHRIDLRSDAAALEAGADVRGSGLRFGLRGYWADRSRDDGIAFRIRDAGSSGVAFAVVGALGGPASGAAIPGMRGLLHLQATLLFPILLRSGNLDPSGTSTSVPFPAPWILPAPFGAITAQAIVDPFGSPRLTNAVAIQDS